MIVEEVKEVSNNDKIEYESISKLECFDENKKDNLNYTDIKNVNHKNIDVFNKNLSLISILILGVLLMFSKNKKSMVMIIFTICLIATNLIKK